MREIKASFIYFLARTFTAIRPYLSRPRSRHSSADGMAPRGTKMSAWQPDDVGHVLEGIKTWEFEPLEAGRVTWSPQKTDTLPSLPFAYTPVWRMTASRIDSSDTPPPVRTSAGSLTPGLLLFSDPMALRGLPDARDLAAARGGCPSPRCDKSQPTRRSSARGPGRSRPQPLASSVVRGGGVSCEG
jgi:hypothetical protein